MRLVCLGFLFLVSFIEPLSMCMVVVARVQGHDAMLRDARVARARGPRGVEQGTVLGNSVGDS